MKSIDRRFDAIVIGSGAGGSIAVKELTERGMDVLLLEAGRDLTEADFVPPPPGTRHGSWGWTCTSARRPRLPASTSRLAGRSSARRRTGSSSTTARTPTRRRATRPYLWIRGRILGGWLRAYRRVLQRMSWTSTSKRRAGTGMASDWPTYGRPRAGARRGRGVRRRLRQRGRDRTPAGRQVRGPRRSCPTSSRSSRRRSRSGGPIER